MVPGPGDRLAARLTGFTTRHDGEPFEPELWFNHAPNISYRDLRDTLFEVTGGRLTAGAAPAAAAATCAGT